MKGDRERILLRLQQAKCDFPAPTARRPYPASRSEPRAGLIEQMRKTHIDVAELATIGDVTAWVATYARGQQVPPRLVGGAALARLPWQAAGLQFEQRAAVATDALAISEATCGIAESGTALLQSGPDNPSSLNFLPDHHIIVLHANTVVSRWEDAWQHCRELWQGKMPRAVHAVSGPSSTADVGLIQVFGAHGPRNLTVLVVG
jgi:L-lactate dehydrogenase complex protein LldG